MFAMANHSLPEIIVSWILAFNICHEGYGYISCVAKAAIYVPFKKWLIR